MRQRLEVEPKPFLLDVREPWHSGQRSLAAAGYLIQLGYTDIQNVDGGTAAWIERGYPVET